MGYCVFLRRSIYSIEITQREKKMNSDKIQKLAKLLLEIEDSNNKVLALSAGRVRPSEQGLGEINNNACDVAFLMKQLKELLTT
jgi:hypothetical protein